MKMDLPFFCKVVLELPTKVDSNFDVNFDEAKQSHVSKASRYINGWNQM